MNVFRTASVLTLALLAGSSAYAQEAGTFLRMQMPESMAMPEPLYDPVEIALTSLVQRRPGTAFTIPFEVSGGDPSIRPSLRNAPSGVALSEGGISVGAGVTGIHDVSIAVGEVLAPVRIQVQALAAGMPPSTRVEATTVVDIRPTASGVFGTPRWEFGAKPANWPSTLILDEATGAISGSAPVPVTVSGARLRLSDSGDGVSALTDPFSIIVDGKSCPSPWGATVPHGQQVTYFNQATVPYYQTCASVRATVTCNNGALPTLPTTAVESCQQSTEAEYAARATERAAAIKIAAEALAGAMRSAIGPAGCSNGSFCYPLSTIVARGWLPPMLTVSATNDVTLTADGVQFSMRSISRYSPDNMQFHTQLVRKSDCMAILADPPARMWNVSHGGGQQQVATLNTPAARNAFCSASATTLSMFFNQ